MKSNLKVANKELRTKILEGLDLTFKKLVAEKKKNDDVLIFCKDGEIIEVKAADFKY